MADYSRYQWLQLCSPSSYQLETRLLRRAYDYTTATSAFPYQPNWYSPDGVFPYPIVYDKDWSVVASGVTISSSSISRLDCVSGIVDFGGAITGGSVYLNAYTYKVGNQSGVAVTQARTISRAPSRDLRDVTPYGSQYRQRLAGRPEVSWTLDFLAGDPDVDVMQRMLAGGKTNLMYLLGHKVAMADGAPFNGYAAVLASYLAHCLVDSVEVTGKVDGLIEGVLSLKVTPQDDALRGTRIYEEIDVSQWGRSYTLGPAAVGATVPAPAPSYTVPDFGFRGVSYPGASGAIPTGTSIPQDWGSQSWVSTSNSGGSIIAGASDSFYFGWGGVAFVNQYFEASETFTGKTIALRLFIGANAISTIVSVAGYGLVQFYTSGPEVHNPTGGHFPQAVGAWFTLVFRFDAGSTTSYIVDTAYTTTGAAIPSGAQTIRLGSAAGTAAPEMLVGALLGWDNVTITEAEIKAAMSALVAV